MVTKLLGRRVNLRNTTAELDGKQGTIEAAYLEESSAGYVRPVFLVEVEGLVYSTLYTQIELLPVEKQGGKAPLKFLTAEQLPKPPLKPVS